MPKSWQATCQTEEDTCAVIVSHLHIFAPLVSLYNLQWCSSIALPRMCNHLARLESYVIHQYVRTYTGNRVAFIRWHSIKYVDMVVCA